VKIHSFLALEFNESEWSASRSGRFNPNKTKSGTHLIGSWVSSQRHSGGFGEEIISCLYEDLNTQNYSPWPSTYTELSQLSFGYHTELLKDDIFYTFIILFAVYLTMLSVTQTV
jgi:hypothetical protein